MNIKFSQIVKNCPLCKGIKIIPFGGRNNFGYRIEYFICERCSLIFMNPRMNESETFEFYKSYYRILYQNDDMPTTELINTQKVRGEHIAKEFFNFCKINKIKPNSYLDIGCSTGTHLQAIETLFKKINVLGIEPGDNYRQFVKTIGIEVYANLNELKILNKKVDAIAMSHVLEHIADPLGYLIELRNKFLKENGLLILEVPNTIGGHGSFEIAHPICFTPKSLDLLCAQAGFERVFRKIHNVTQEKIPKNLYLLAIYKYSSKLPIGKIKKTSSLLTRIQRRKGMKKEGLLLSIYLAVRDHFRAKNKVK